MAKERGLTDYLNDWGKTDAPAPEVDGAGTDGGDYEDGVPYRADEVPNPEWGGQGGVDAGAGGGYGHSDDVADTGTKSSAWGMGKDDQAQGYERLDSGGAGEPGTASFPQSIPDTNEFDRGAGSASRAKEFATTEGKGFDGRGNQRSTPGKEQVGSSKLPE